MIILAYATIFGLVQIICTWVGSHKLFAYLKERDEREQKERQLLLTRIQAPSTAIALTAEPRDDIPPQYVPWDDDEAFAHSREDQ